MAHSQGGVTGGLSSFSADGPGRKKLGHLRTRTSADAEKVGRLEKSWRGGVAKKIDWGSAPPTNLWAILEKEQPDKRHDDSPYTTKMNPNTFDQIQERFMWRIAANVEDEEDEANRAEQVDLWFSLCDGHEVWEDDAHPATLACQDLVEMLLDRGLDAWGSDENCLWANGQDEEGRNYEVEIERKPDGKIAIHVTLRIPAENEDVEMDIVEEDPIAPAAA
jgi:hypothetical protein